MHDMSPLGSAILGLLIEGPSTLQAIVKSLKTLGGAEWQPTADAVLAAVERACESGSIRVDAETARLEITGAGVERFQANLARPLDGSNTVSGRLMVALKIRFLHALKPGAARVVVTDLTRSHGDAIKDLRVEYSRAQSRGLPTSEWLRHEMERHAWEMQWLESLPAARRPCVGRPHEAPADRAVAS